MQKKILTIKIRSTSLNVEEMTNSDSFEMIWGNEENTIIISQWTTWKETCEDDSSLIQKLYYYDKNKWQRKKLVYLLLITFVKLKDNSFIHFLVKPTWNMQDIQGQSKSPINNILWIIIPTNTEIPVRITIMREYPLIHHSRETEEKKKIDRGTERERQKEVGAHHFGHGIW